MLHIFNSKDAKQTARSLERFMARLGFNLKHGQALDALGVMAGFENWAGLDGSMSEKALDALLVPAALRHIRENEDNDYGREYAVVAHTGFELRYDVEGEVTYLRVCDPLGREIAYWVSEEWAESPEEVLGAVLGALAQGAPVEVGKRQRGLSLSDKGHLSNSAIVPVILDVPFDKVSSVEIDNMWYPVTFVEDQLLGQLSAQPGDPDEESDAFHVVVLFGVDREGLTLHELRGLRWNTAKRCFIDRQARRYQFNIAQSFADFIQASPRIKKVNAAVSVAEEKPVLRTYAVRVRPTLELRAAAKDAVEAEAAIRARAASRAETLPVPLSMRVVPDADAGPFRVAVDGDEYDSAPYLSHAVSIAQILEPSAERCVEVFDSLGNLLWSI